MTEIIIGDRQSGKSTELIKRSEKTGAIIVTASKTMAICLYQDALRNGYNIPMPISINEYMNRKYDERIPVLMDEFELILRSIFNFEKIEAITLTKREYSNVKYLKKSSEKGE